MCTLDNDYKAQKHYVKRRFSFLFTITKIVAIRGYCNYFGYAEVCRGKCN